MLAQLVDILKDAKSEVNKDALFCYEVVISSTETLDYITILEENSFLENSDYDKRLNNTVNLELSIGKLKSIGFYESFDEFIIKHRFKLSTRPYYIYNERKYGDELVVFSKQHTAFINFVDGIKKIAKHSYTDVDEEYSIIFREDKSVLLWFQYDVSIINKLDDKVLEGLKYIAEVFTLQDSEKKLFFMNELIEFTSNLNEDVRFSHLVHNAPELCVKAENAYQFYLRDFSFNKLKLELDSKALEYSQKIQSVINDAQTKLIAIPSAFVLVYATFDFSELRSFKNAVAISSLFIFSILLQLFLNNQKSILKFTWENILSYKETFKKNDVAKISSKFSLVEEELHKQRGRLLKIQWILWLIPSMLVVLWVIMINEDTLMPFLMRLVNELKFYTMWII